MYCEPVQVCRHEYRKAKQLHRCSCCLGWIKAKESYHIYHVLFEGEWRDYKVCDDCEDFVIKEQAGKHQEEGVAFGCLIEYIEESENVEDMKWLLDLMKARGSPNREVRWLEKRLAFLVEHERLRCRSSKSM